MYGDCMQCFDFCILRLDIVALCSICVCPAYKMESPPGPVVSFGGDSLCLEVYYLFPDNSVICMTS